jgi:chemotaxis protein methyltransferase CheR
LATFAFIAVIVDDRARVGRITVRRATAVRIPGTPGNAAVDYPAVTSAAFFREPAHCELLAQTVLPGLASAPGRRALTLWSAGCESGEDAWSLAMVVDEAHLPTRVEVSILATERDPATLAAAGTAVYGDHQMHSVNAERRQRYFVRGVGPRAGQWRVVARLRDRIEFAELDLMSPWPARTAFDVVMCHDALARLDGRSAALVVRRFGDALAPGGVMLLGGPASPSDLPRLEPYGPDAYRKIA